jgi:cyclopropane-fatty-acyl-phospholipid synthase
MSAPLPTRPAPVTGWPDVTSVPTARARAVVARELFRRAVARLPVRVLEPGRSSLVGGGGPQAPILHLRRPDDFFARIGTGGLIGFGESYLAGDWAALPAPASGPGADPLVELLTVFAAELGRLVPPSLQRLRRVAVRRRPRAETNTPGGARSNVARHYDLSNDLFATFLDPTLTYSGALFDGEMGETGDAGDAGWADLAGAQARKIDRLLDACRVGPGTDLLEIGTGWGELAIRAATRGARVRSVTLSEEQLVLARARAARAGVGDRVAVELCDYRAVRGRYDAVISVEMIEAVGEAFWPVYFRTLDRVLAPGGTVGLQSITMPHDRMLASRRTWTWIHKYVFPGGLIPSVPALHQAAGLTSLRVVDDLAFGSGYAQTLRLWRERFTERADDVQRLGFDPVFCRMWTFYLAYCEAGFRSRYLDVHQFTLRRVPGPVGGPPR